jgi:hypothetical protein
VEEKREKFFKEGTREKIFEVEREWIFGEEGKRRDFFWERKERKKREGGGGGRDF